MSPAFRSFPDVPIRYLTDQLPAAGDTLDIAPGIRWVRMPLPFALDHVNLWLIEDDDGWTVVDTGIHLEALKHDWNTLLAKHRLTRQIVTHCHPDHLGLAAWLERTTGAPVWMAQSEFAVAHLLRAEIDDSSIAAILRFFRRHGLDETRLAALEARGNGFLRGVPEMPSSYRRLMHGDEIRIGKQVWRAIAGYGHSPEHIALYCDVAHVLISGDMLLPRISTNVSVLPPAPEGDPLRLFLRSIEELRTLPDDTLVLPSHGRPFRGLHARVAQLQKHHRERCAALLAHCVAPKSAKDLLPVLFGREIDDAHQILFAMGETIAHLNHLAGQGVLRRMDDRDRDTSSTIRFICTH